MKKFVKKLAVFATATTLSASVLADWQPSGPIKMMIGFAAGGGADTQARLIAEDIEALKGWKIIPEQVTGGGGTKLAAELMNEPADGLSFGMVVSETLAYNNLANPGATFDHTDFTPIATTASFQMGVVAKTDRGYSDFSDVIKAAKAGESIRFGAMSAKLADLAYMLGAANDVEFNIVEVKGGQAVSNGLNAGDLDVGFVAGNQAKAVRAGDMTNLASAISEPLVMQPEAPLLKNYGLDFTADGYFMFIAPKGLSSEARTALSAAIEQVATDPNSKSGKFITRAFGKPVVITGTKLEELIERDRGRSALLLKAASE